MCCCACICHFRNWAGNQSDVMRWIYVLYFIYVCLLSEFTLCVAAMVSRREVNNCNSKNGWILLFHKMDLQPFAKFNDKSTVYIANSFLLFSAACFQAPKRRQTKKNLVYTRFVQCSLRCLDNWKKVWRKAQTLTWKANRENTIWAPPMCNDSSAFIFSQIKKSCGKSQELLSLLWISWFCLPFARNKIWEWNTTCASDVRL